MASGAVRNNLWGTEVGSIDVDVLGIGDKCYLTTQGKQHQQITLRGKGVGI